MSDLDALLEIALLAFDKYQEHRAIAHRYFGEANLSLLQSRMSLRSRFLDIEVDTADIGGDTLTATLVVTQEGDVVSRPRAQSEKDPALWWTPAPPPSLFTAQQQFRSAAVALMDVLRFQKEAEVRFAEYEAAVEAAKSGD